MEKLEFQPRSVEPPVSHDLLLIYVLLLLWMTQRPSEREWRREGWPRFSVRLEEAEAGVEGAWSWQAVCQDWEILPWKTKECFQLRLFSSCTLCTRPKVNQNTAINSIPRIPITTAHCALSIWRWLFKHPMWKWLGREVSHSPFEYTHVPWCE